jgi:hypothetical protein
MKEWKIWQPKKVLGQWFKLRFFSCLIAIEFADLVLIQTMLTHASFHDWSARFFSLCFGSPITPFCFLTCTSGPMIFKWIEKRSLFCIPVLGWLFTGWGHAAIGIFFFF